VFLHYTGPHYFFQLVRTLFFSVFTEGSPGTQPEVKLPVLSAGTWNRDFLRHGRESSE
jgi:hypothetical protein